MLFAPAVTVPMMGVGGMPVGVQLMGQQHEDARVTAMARWLLAVRAADCRRVSGNRMRPTVG